LVKSGKFFSIFAVLTLLILLAPAVIFVPNVAADEEVVQEVTATFSFNETTNGDWWSFTAGSGGVQPEGNPRLCLEQYTRDNVVIPGATANVSGCEFRNYTTGSGSVVGGGLDGSLSLAWITSNFNMKYSHTPLYHDYGSGAHFGWMMGRGHIGSDLTFVVVADFDSDDATMSNAMGKGFMLSMNETGDFAGHKIIGDLVFTKTGTSYSGTFNLRNYAPNEVYDLSWLNVSGGVLQEFTDAIHNPVALVNYISDGPYITPTNITTDFEEIDWGKDPIKNVTSGRLGVGGKMDLSRNTALYLELMGASVRIQGTTACNLYINDTYAVTGDDGSPYGGLYELLLLYIPDQTLAIGEFFFQNGYTFTPFGLFHPSTGCYAGEENYALAGVAIESAVGTAQQWSTDISYGLYPHPKLTSVVPNTGMPGTTMNVTIKGKYLLRAAGQKSGFANNSGSVSFGPNVTVNSYSFKNSSPIDNEITASITIAGGSSGARDVNVTSCFGYAGGNGAAPYKSGVLSSGFTISSAAGTLQGHVDLKRKVAAGCTTWVTPITVRFFANGTKVEAGFSPINVTTDAYGNFNATGVGAGTYDVGVKNWTCLSRMSLGQVFSAGNTTTINFTTAGVLTEADTDNDDQVKLADFNRISANFNAKPGDPNWNAMYDFDRSGKIDVADFNLVLTNYNAKGDIYKYQH
jgi:hypothetical protein